MSRFRLFAFGALIVAALAYFYWPSASRDDGAKWLQGRAWASHYPTSQKDIVRWLVPLKVRKKRFGVLQASSHFRFAGERFLWRLDQRGKRMVLYFQQSGVKSAVDVRTWECSGSAPKPFELCLELKQGKRRALMYSKKSWTYPREEPADDALVFLPEAMGPPAAETAIPTDAVEGLPADLQILGL